MEISFVMPYYGKQAHFTSVKIVTLGGSASGTVTELISVAQRATALLQSTTIHNSRRTGEGEEGEHDLR